MKNIVSIMKLLSDPARLRILMILTKKELCVCQIMGVLGISQPLVSRNLKLLDDSGFIQSRKKGKLVFYSVQEKMPGINFKIAELLKDVLGNDPVLKEDLKSLRDCEEFQKKTGKCDMETFLSYIEKKRNKRSKEK
ncbi:MAG: metalloregulator ArsR/SmtB family transcription factor [Nitrospirota bacterium]